MANNFIQTSFFDEQCAIYLAQITGLTYIPDCINSEQEDDLIKQIDNQPWLHDLKRRVQHYGYKYDYKARNILSSMKLGGIPDWLLSTCEELYKRNIFPKVPDQVIINEYQPGQGISPHIDCVPCFEETIASLSLGSACVMEFTHDITGRKVPVFLEPRSLVYLRGDARYYWKHAIPPRKNDCYNGAMFSRGRRISLTFRNVIIN